MGNIFFNPSSNILTFKRHYFKGHFVRIECISFKTCSWTNIARVLALMIEMLGIKTWTIFNIHKINSTRCTNCDYSKNRICTKISYHALIGEKSVYVNFIDRVSPKYKNCLVIVVFGGFQTHSYIKVSMFT